MELTVGAIVEGKVTGITKFGAFVTMPGGSSGLVHISEIANAYVNNVSDYLTVGQTVKVKVLSITPEGKVNLSVKQAEPAPEKAAAEHTAPRRTAPKPQPQSAPQSANRSASAADLASAQQGVVHGPTGDASFEDKLKHFMQESDSRMSGNKLYAEKKNSSRRRK